MNILNTLEIVVHSKLNPKKILTLMVCRGSGCRMNELSSKLKLSTAAITGIADSLEQARLIEREVTRNDRRSYTLKTTDLGLKFLKRFGDAA